jgi:hypothetical protein
MRSDMSATALVPRASRNFRGAGLDLALSTRLLPGLGYATVTKNGEIVIELDAAEAESGMTAADTACPDRLQGP